jgi:acyl-CoA thioesterase FadM
MAMTFVAPVYAGDEVVLRSEVSEVSSENLNCKVECWVADRLVLTGEAGVKGSLSDG